MKKSVNLVFVFLLVLIASTSALASWTGTITLWSAPSSVSRDGDKFFWIKEKIAEFEANNPGVKIEMIETPWAEMGEKLNVAIAGRSWPDLVPVDDSGTVNFNHIEQGVVEPLDAFISEEELADFFPGALEAYTYKGKLYGLPLSMSVHSILLNLDHFAEAGVEPPVDGRWTWDEFVEKAKALTFDSTGDGVIDKYGFSTYILQGYYEAWPFFLMDGGVPLKDGKFAFDSPEAISAIQKLVDLKFVHGAAPVEMGSSDVGGTFRALAREDERFVAMQPWNNWAIASVTTEGRNYMPNVGIAEYPIGELGRPISISGVGGWIALHQTDKEKLAVIVDLMRLLTSTESQYFFAVEGARLPARKSTLDLDPFADSPLVNKAAEILEQAVPLPDHLNWAQIDDRIQAELQLIFAGEKTVEQGMKDAADQVARLLK